MNGIDQVRARLAHLHRPAGGATRDLTIGGAAIRFEGLSEEHASILDERWGGFVTPPAPGAPRVVVRTVCGDDAVWLPKWQPGEGYRLVADAGGTLVVLSYHFALVAETGNAWRFVVQEQQDEPTGRIFDNAARYLVARMAIESGGLAFHGAGIRRDGRAWIFVGPSGAGKSTAVALSAPSESLGDDFAIVRPQGDGWVTAAVPFDNAEGAPQEPTRGTISISGVCRLYQAKEHSVRRPEGAMAQASILACCAFPWTVPDLTSRIEDAVARLAASGLYRHLHFAPDAGFWPLLTDGP